jgi:glycerophosphoryl diester phosphodiesterase
MSSLMQSSGPLIFAHRGASAYAPENTLASFRLAAELGADGIELDTKLSSDGVVVVMHDQTVDRTTNGKGSTSNLTADALHQLDAGSHFSLKYKGEPVPTLEEVFEAVGNRVYINVELTNYASPLDALPGRVAELIRKHGLVDRVIISSFHPLNLIRFRKLLPSVPLALLALKGQAGGWARSWVGGLFPQNALHPYFSDVDAALVERVHRGGKKVNVWTVNNEAEICRLLACKVDGIITDDPVLAKKVL